MSADLTKTKEALVAELEAARREIAELKRASGDLKQAEERYSTVFDISPLAFIVWDRDCLITDWNAKAEKMFGWTKGEALGANFFELIIPEESRVQVEAVVASLMDGTFREHSINANVTKSGGTIFCEWNNALLRDRDGSLLGVISLGLDITGRKKADEALVESEKKLQHLIKHLHAGVVVHSSDTKIVIANEQASNLLGLTIDQMKGKAAIDPAWCFIHEDETPMTVEEYPIARVFTTRSPVHNMVVGVVRPFTNDLVWVLVNAFPEFESDGQVSQVVVTFVNITDRKRAEKEKELLNQELMSKNEELEQIVYVSSHDLRSPLVNIQGFSKELESCFQDVASALESGDASPDLRQQLAPLINEDIPEALGFIGVSVSKMDGLLAGLLKLSRLGRLAFAPKKLDMNKLLANVVAAHEFQLKESKVVFTLEELPPCYGDETQINQVFSNLLGNALKYLAPERSGVITVSGRKDKKNSVYCVEDNGIGVPEGQHGGIFEIFRRLNPKENPGEGLGLTIVRRITDRHQGEIWLESELGTGSKFYVSLPRMSKA